MLFRSDNIWTARRELALTVWKSLQALCRLFGRCGDWRQHQPPQTRFSSAIEESAITRSTWAWQGSGISPAVTTSVTTSALNRRRSCQPTSEASTSHRHAGSSPTESKMARDQRRISAEWKTMDTSASGAWRVCRSSAPRTDRSRKGMQGMPWSRASRTARGVRLAPRPRCRWVA